mmetsp:Transcript_49357/g.77122  ORF Transcript_49357/g.77122 Transcript_49357/m.77122 type:complete len:87 (-) Transcript_49357:1476-1736(-)
MELDIGMVGQSLPYLEEGQDVTVYTTESGEPMSMEQLAKASCKVVSTDGKTATLANGRMVPVPSFIKPGDTIVVNVEEESYVERVN